ncbi:unnamed protein product [Phytomonas sp. Hart1]|nr:unnamed protein product [Phytomonas sp. Hart1]|eukprot:CCW70067.1 unnamed protein product [Phytomonas sp. isolate Hart1]
MHTNIVVPSSRSSSKIIRNFIVSIICIAIIYSCGVISTIRTSQKTNNFFLYLSFFGYAVFCGMWIYTNLFLRKRNHRWSHTNKRFIYSATICSVFSSVLWIIGMWPEYHWLTLPLFLVIVIMVVHIVGISHGMSKKVS